MLLALVLLLAFAATSVSFREDISAFLPKGHNTDRIDYAYKYAGSANKLIVTVCMADTTAVPDEELIIDAISHFVEQLQQADSTGIYFKKTDYRVDGQQILAVSQFLVENMPYFFTENDYQRIDSLLTEENIRFQIDNIKRMLMSPVGMVMKQNIMTDPLHLSAPVLEGLRDFQVSNRFELYNDFIFSSDRKEGIITIESRNPVSETRHNAKMLKVIDQAAANTQQFFDQKINIHYFGSVAIAVTNAERIKNDSLLSSIVAIVLILSILMYAFRSVKNLLLMLGSLLFGWLFALGLLSILKDEISLVAVGISSIIIGIAINYPLHFIMHHRHEPSIPNVIKDIAAPLTIGNITTVGAFLSLIFISSAAMRDLGLFASLLLAGTVCFVLFFLPHLLKNNSQTIKYEPAYGKLLSWKPKRRKLFAWIFILISVVLCIFSFNTKFDTNMNNINYMTETQKADFKKYISTIEQGQHTIYYVSEGKNLDEALAAFEDSKATLDSLQITGMLSRINGLGVYLPSKDMQRQRLERWKSFCKNNSEALEMIDKIGVEYGFKSGAFSRFDNIVKNGYEVQDIDYFKPITSMFADNYIINENGRSMVITLLHTPHNEQAGILEAELNRVNPQSFSFDAGTLSRSMVSSLSADFNKVLFICGIIVFMFLIFMLGRIELSLLAFLPLAVGWFWILGIMNIFDIRFNIVNIILAAFIFGQGDDYSIFMTEGLMYEYTYRRKLLASYKNSIILSSLIMFIGIGSLILARHPALRSLAEITIIGMGSVVLMTFLLPPIVFRWLTLKKGKRRLMPITLANFTASVYSFTVFLFGIIISSVVGFFCFTFGKITDKKKYRFHKLICWCSRFVVKRIPRVKTTYNEFDKTIFDKPAVIICNHQSHIDLMCVMSLTPKIIILTNDWVWNSPFYGRLVKYADFYPVSNGIENAMDKLKAITEKGYSIMVFPEGSRSEDCTIQRFHRGAFYLAEQLKLDILPVLIHGVGHFLPKKEFMLRKGEIHINVMPRMEYNTLGNSYFESAKNMRKFYKDEYAKLAETVETADYYSDLTIHNYIYKGPMVERAVKRNLKKHGNYRNIISQLKTHSSVLIENCGYGEFPLLLSLVYKNMNIIATEKDTDKLELATNCTSVPSNLQYVPILNDKDMGNFDCVVDMKGGGGQMEISK